MVNEAKKTLSLPNNPRTVSPDETKLVQVLELILPCRRFKIDYQIGVLGSLGPTTEFLLRLVKYLPRISIGDAANFFGFDDTEIDFVVGRAQASGFISTESERLTLTPAGSALFRSSDERPSEFLIQSRSQEYGFDMISLCPQRPEYVSHIQSALPELDLTSEGSTPRKSDSIKDSFRRFFVELMSERDRSEVDRRDLYSLDSVVATSRFPSIVKVKVRIKTDSPSEIDEIDLSEWRPEHELADRLEIQTAVARKISNLLVSRKTIQFAECFRILQTFAPRFFSNFSSSKDLPVKQYWDVALEMSSQPKSTVKTVPILGSVLAGDNPAHFGQVLKQGLKNRSNVNSALIVIAPSVPFWGATEALNDLIEFIKYEVDKTGNDGAISDQSSFTSVCLFNGKPDAYVSRQFDRTFVSDRSPFPPSLEIYLIPGVMVCALANGPISAAQGIPVPVGFASFDPDVVGAVSSRVTESIYSFETGEENREWLTSLLTNAPDTAEEVLN